MTARKSVKKAIAVALVTGAALVSDISPAAADGIGVTSFGMVGNSSQMDVALCRYKQAAGTVYDGTVELVSTGTFNSGDYIWDSVATFTPSVGYYLDRLRGTYADFGCSTPYAVPGTLEVHGRDEFTNDLICDDGTDLAAPVPATYQLVNGRYTVATVGDITCDVYRYGRNYSSRETSRLTFTGHQHPVSFQTYNPQDPTFSHFTDGEFEGTYIQGG